MTKGKKAKTTQKTQPRLPKKGTPEREIMPASFVQYIKKRQPRVIGYGGGPHSKGQPVVVNHEELFFTVAIPSNATTTYQTLNSGAGFPIQPGTNVLFPWLSSLAQNFEQYRFRRFTVRYYTRVGTTTNGELTVLVDTDVNDPKIPDGGSGQVSAISYDDRMNGPAYCERPREFSVLSQDLHPDGNRKYVRTVSSPNTNDAKTFDCGNVWVAAEGFAASTAATWGYLTVEYEIELFKPQVPLTVSSVLAGFAGGGGGLSWTPNNLFNWFSRALTANGLQAGRDLFGAGLGNSLTILGLTPGQVYQIVTQAYAAVGPTSASGISYTSALGAQIEAQASGSSAFGNQSAVTWNTMVATTFVALAPIATFTLTQYWTNGGVSLSGVFEVTVNAIPAQLASYAGSFPSPNTGNSAVCLDKFCSEQTLSALRVFQQRVTHPRLCDELSEKSANDLFQFAEREAREVLRARPSVDVPPALRGFIQ